MTSVITFTAASGPTPKRIIMLAHHSQLCTLGELTIAGANAEDVAAFTGEVGTRFVHATGEVIALYCPSCAPSQFDLMATRQQCPRCRTVTHPGSALLRKDATTVLAAFGRFPLEVLPAVEKANSHLLGLARTFHYSTPLIHGAPYRTTRWAYSRRGQHAIAKTMHELDVATRDAQLYLQLPPPWRSTPTDR